MAAALEPLLLTVEQYRLLSDQGDAQHELHWGQVVTLTRPRARHIKLQSRLVRLLRPMAEHLGYVESELPFRALPEYDLRAADVAFISQERWEATGDEEDLSGTPELVIEVMSKSNTSAKMRELAALCLSANTVEFWVVDPYRKTIGVTLREGATSIFRENDVVPIKLFGTKLALNQVFAIAR